MFLEEHGTLVRFEATVGGNETCVAGIFTDLDGDNIVLELHRCRRRKLRHLNLDLRHFRRSGSCR
jgi:hypothetical protein